MSRSNFISPSSSDKMAFFSIYSLSHPLVLPRRAADRGCWGYCTRRGDTALWLGDSFSGAGSAPASRRRPLYSQEFRCFCNYSKTPLIWSYHSIRQKWNNQLISWDLFLTLLVLYLKVPIFDWNKNSETQMHPTNWSSSDTCIHSECSCVKPYLVSLGKTQQGL